MLNEKAGLPNNHNWPNRQISICLNSNSLDISGSEDNDDVLNFSENG
jgi:hypothetical protein